MDAALRHSDAHVLVDSLPDALALDDEVEHHLRRVLRLREGAVVSATDGRGAARIYRIGSADPLTLEADSAPLVVTRDREPMTLVCAIPKGDRVDWLVQKATEVGVERIEFVHAERSVVRWKPERARKQVERLQRIADEALRQSRRVHRVEVVAPVPARGRLVDAVVAEPGGRRPEPTDTVVAIGPEGGWTAEELQAALDRVDLGSAVLRTETAAVAAVLLTAR